MRRKILPFILGGALSVAAVAPAAAVHTPAHVVQANDAVQNALVGLIVQANVRDVNVLNISDSLNNLLQNADIDINVLNNLLQNADIDVTVTDVTVVGDSIVITLLSGDTITLG